MNNTILILLLAITLSCNKKIEKKVIAQEVQILNAETDTGKSYDVNKPDKVWSMTSDLKEISGLTYDYKRKKLLAVNDEKGKYFTIDMENGKVLKTSKFGKKGDYEGIEFVNENIYVTNSDGQISLVKEDGKAEPIRTNLREDNDIEGLGYDPKSSSLLLACKGKSKISSTQTIKKSKSVYAFDLESKTLAPEPFLIISDESLYAYLDQNINKDLDEATIKKFRKRVKSFAPSGITLHEETDQFYIVSSVGKLLVIVNRDSSIEKVQFLDEALHAQPEGITFDENNHLYISNEGKFGIAKIYVYN